MNKLVKFVAGTVNTTAIVAIAVVAGFSIRDAEAQERLQVITTDDLHCLQQNIYFEARNQSVIGQVAVAWVTMNRMEDSRYPDTICEVVWQRKQFSWTHDGKSDEPGSNILEQRAWEDAGLVADVVLLDWARDRSSPVEEAVMYHADYVDPYWSASYDYVAKIDNHIFYR